jgi:hypothetical protein
MHRHTVLFNLKEESDETQVIEKLKELAALPTVVTMVLEKNIVPVSDHSPYKWCLIGDFNDTDSREAYEKHEKHVEIIKTAFLPNISGFIMSDINF